MGLISSLFMWFREKRELIDRIARQTRAMQELARQHAEAELLLQAREQTVKIYKELYQATYDQNVALLAEKMERQEEIEDLNASFYGSGPSAGSGRPFDGAQGGE